MITINWEVTVESGTETASWEDLNVKDRAEWDALSENEKYSKANEFLWSLPDQVGIVVDGIED